MPRVMVLASCLICIWTSRQGLKRAVGGQEATNHMGASLLLLTRESIFFGNAKITPHPQVQVPSTGTRKAASWRVG